MKDERTLLERLRGSYRSMHGVVVVSPVLLNEAATRIEELEAENLKLKSL